MDGNKYILVLLILSSLTLSVSRVVTIPFLPSFTPGYGCYVILTSEKNLLESSKIFFLMSEYCTNKMLAHSKSSHVDFNPQRLCDVIIT